MSICKFEKNHFDLFSFLFYKTKGLEKVFTISKFHSLEITALSFCFLFYPPKSSTFLVKLGNNSEWKLPRSKVDKARNTNLKSLFTWESHLKKSFSPLSPMSLLAMIQWDAILWTLIRGKELQNLWTIPLQRCLTVCFLSWISMKLGRFCGV